MPQSSNISGLFDRLPDLDADDILHALNRYLKFRKECRNLVQLPEGVSPENLIQIVAVTASCRKEGVNPDLSTISRETGISRAKLRRMHEVWILDQPDRSILVQDGRRTVMEDGKTLGPESSQLVRIVTKYFGGHTVQ